MLQWVTSWWSGVTIGPARNAPNDGKNIKATLEQKPTQVVLLGEDEIKRVLSTLRKTTTNPPQTVFKQPPLFEELHSVLSQGHASYFQMIKKKKLQNQSNADIEVTQT